MKVHLASSPDPLQERSRIAALCGLEIARAFFVLTYEGDFSPEILRVIDGLRNCCAKCKRQPITESCFYVYGIVSCEDFDEVAA